MKHNVDICITNEEEEEVPFQTADKEAPNFEKASSISYSSQT